MQRETLDVNSLSHLSDDERRTVAAAIALAHEIHTGFWRLKDHEPYISHPLAVAQTVSEWLAPGTVIAAALLHDAHNRNYARSGFDHKINALLGDEVASLVESVSTLNRITAGKFASETGADFTADLHAISLDGPSPEAVAIKLADRIHNLETIDALEYERQQRSAILVQSEFLPLADQLGVIHVKNKLDNLSFEITNRLDIVRLRSFFDATDYDDLISDQLKFLRKLVSGRLEVTDLRWQWRPYSSMASRQIDHGSPALRLVSGGVFIFTVPDSESCYRLMGHLHSQLRPVDRSIHDYIADPKPNGYRALSTQLINKAKDIHIPISLRTRNMDLVDEFGWFAKWSGVPEEHLPKRKLSLPNLQDKIRVYTPTREARFLPIGSTVIDFAYSIHHEIGHHVAAARVNGVLVPLNKVLLSDEVIEIMTDELNEHTSREWLDFVRTAEAKDRIRGWLSRQQRERMTAFGRELLDTELRLSGMTLAMPSIASQITHIAKTESLDNLDDLLILIGTGRFKPKDIARRLESMGEIEIAQNVRPLNHKVARLKTINAHCCSPMPPDAIIGVRRGDVLEIHQSSCSAIGKKSTKEPVEWVTVYIDSDVSINVFAWNRPGLAHELAEIVSSQGLDMPKYTAESLSDGRAGIQIRLGKLNPAQLRKVIAQLEQAPGVIPPVTSSAFVASEVSPVLAHTVTTGIGDCPFNTTKVARGTLFKGRDRDCQDLLAKVQSPSRSIVVLWGQKRIGKSSVLERIKDVVGEQYIAARVDLGVTESGSVAIVANEIMKWIGEECHKRFPDSSNQLTWPNLNRLKKDPLSYLGTFIDRCRQATGNMPLLILLDEFQALTTLRDNEVATGSSLFSFLRALVNGSAEVHLVLSGAGMYSKMMEQPGLSDMLNRSVEQRLSYLDAAAAGELVGLLRKTYTVDPDAIEYLHQVTAGHPYYLQLIGQHLWLTQSSRRRRLSFATAQESVADWVAAAREASFRHLWTGTSKSNESDAREVRAVLAVLANRRAGSPGLEPKDVISALSASTWGNRVYDHLGDLVDLEIVQRVNSAYSIRVDVFAKWLLKNWPLDRAIHDVSNK